MTHIRDDSPLEGKKICCERFREALQHIADGRIPGTDMPTPDAAIAREALAADREEAEIE